MLFRAAIVTAVVLPSAWCGQKGTTVEFYLGEGHHFSEAERETIRRVAETTDGEIRRYLPTLSQNIVLKVLAGKNVIPETGEGGYSSSPNIVYWIVDPDRPGGVAAIARAHLRVSLFEFLHHLVREQIVQPRSLMDHVVNDGMATVFARDFAGASLPWAAYPDNAMDWAAELIALPPETATDVFRSDHRRWITFKTGAYLVDRAIRASGQSSAQLISRSTDEIVRMALGR